MIDLNATGGLPDPVSDARFYDGVPARRLLAFLVDEALGWAIGLTAAFIFGVATLGVGFLAFAPVMALSAFAYRWASLTRWSATPAMSLFGVQLRNRHGERFSASEALAHTAMFYLCLATGVGQVVSVAMMLTSPMGRGVGDALIGSTMIRRPE